MSCRMPSGYWWNTLDSKPPVWIGHNADVLKRAWTTRDSEPTGNKFIHWPYLKTTANCSKMYLTVRASYKEIIKHWWEEISLKRLGFVALTQTFCISHCFVLLYMLSGVLCFSVSRWCLPCRLKILLSPLDHISTVLYVSQSEVCSCLVQVYLINSSVCLYLVAGFCLLLSVCHGVCRLKWSFPCLEYFVFDSHFITLLLNIFFALSSIPPSTRATFCLHATTLNLLYVMWWVCLNFIFLIVTRSRQSLISI